MKVLPVSIFKPAMGDCSNGGISSRYKEILIPCETGFLDVDENDPPENLCKVVKRNLFGTTPYVHIEPWGKPEGAGWMYGGTIVDTSDSRFKRETGVDYPVHLHDRQETWKQYDLMSD